MMPTYFQNYEIFFFLLCTNARLSEAYPERCHTSKIVCFAKIVNDYKPLLENPLLENSIEFSIDERYKDY